jgi:GNAT superfamily N-acetyltransferase
MSLEIRAAVPADAGIIAGLAIALTNEIIERTGMRHFDLDRADLEATCRRLMEQGAYAALLAQDSARVTGYAGMSVSHALYAGGTFGTVQEFYVVPEARSAGAGARLLDAVRDYGCAQGWTRLELCTPPLPEFERTLAFYERNGFEVTGGRKMKATL